MTSSLEGAGGAEGAEGAVVAEAVDGQWHRVHPLTPAIRSWQFFVLLLVFAGQDLGQNALRDGGLPSFSTDDAPTPSGGFLLGGGAALVGLLLAVTGLAVLSWRMTRYRVTEEALELHRGVLFRQQRRARLDRLQAVDVVQPLVARIFGLSRLTLEVAGGSGSKIEVSYLGDVQAQRLRNYLLAGAAGLHYDTTHPPEAPEHQVFDVPLQRLVASLALSPATVFLLLLAAGCAVTVAVTRRVEVFAFLFPFVFPVASVLWNRFRINFGFRVATSADGLRLRHGLLEQRTQTVPPGRVQALRLSQPLLWRPFGWWRVRVNVAGYGASEQELESTLLPVGSRDEAMVVLAFVLPDLGVEQNEQPQSVIDAGLAGTGAALGFVTSPDRARWFDPFSQQRNGFKATRRVLLIRRGFLHRHLDLVPHARTQSCGVQQGPLQRRLALASFALHSTAGPVNPVAVHLASEVAAELLREQSARAHQARLTAGPERWMEWPSA